MAKIIIDAEGAVFGRLCSFAAKRALEGDEIVIVNCDKSVVKGNKNDIINKYKSLINIGGSSQKGPKYSRIPYRMMKRGVSGMLPDHRRGIGKQALAKVMCYDLVPKEYEGAKMTKSGKETPKKSIQLKELSERI
jgi:large subunit ribosomal protein L13